MSTQFVLRTFDDSDLGERIGFSRNFDTMADAQEFTRNNFCGSRHTIEEQAIPADMLAEMLDDVFRSDALPKERIATAADLLRKWKQAA